MKNTDSYVNAKGGFLNLLFIAINHMAMSLTPYVNLAIAAKWLDIDLILLLFKYAVVISMIQCQ